MAKKYELLYVLNGTLAADELKSQMARVHSIVEASAEIAGITEWGRRKLAYEIQDLREGYYVIVHFNAEPDAPKEIERLLRISDDVLRYLIVVQEGSFMPVSRRSLDDEAALEREAEEAAEALEAEKEEEPVQEEAPVAEEAPAAEEEAPAEEAAEATEPEERTEA